MKTPYSRADVYDLDYAGYNADLQFYYSLLNLLGISNGKILELGCGTGRVTLPLAAKGYSITGLDVCKEMISLACEKCKCLPENTKPNFIVADMLSMPLKSSIYDLVIIPFNSFSQILNQEDQIKTLTNIHRVLKSGGYFIAEIGVPTLTRDTLTSQMVKEFPERDRLLVRTMISEADRATQIVRRKFFYQIYEFEKRDLLEHFWVPRDYCNIYPLQWELMLNFTGFDIVNKYGDFEFKTFSKSSNKMLFLSRSSV